MILVIEGKNMLENENSVRIQNRAKNQLLFLGEGDPQHIPCLFHFTGIGMWQQWKCIKLEPREGEEKEEMKWMKDVHFQQSVDHFISSKYMTSKPYFGYLELV